MKSNGAAYALALLYAMIIGFSFLFTKLALRHADPIDLLAYRFALSYAALAIALRIGRTRSPQPATGRKRKGRMQLLLIGLVYPTAFFGFQSFGLDASTTSAAGIFTAIAPIFTLLLGALVLKERPTRLQLLSVCVSVFGLAFMAGLSGGSFEGTTPLGAALMLLSAVSIGLYSVMARRMRSDYSAAQLSQAMMLTGCIVFVLLSLGRHAVQGTLPELLAPWREPGFWLPLFYIALLSSVVSSWLSNLVLARLEAFKVSLFVNLGNLITIVSGVALMHDRWTLAQTVGAACMLAGVLGANLGGGVRVSSRNSAPPLAKGVDAP